jgi:hypothetical protein
MRYLTSCVLCSQSDANDLLDMCDQAIEITHDEFKAALDSDAYDQFEAELGYNSAFRLHQDWHVSYHRSTFRGEPVVYCDHSAIEHIFSDAA